MSHLIHSKISMTVAQNVRSHLRNKPYLLEALEKGIVNLSELSRQIQKELKTNDTSAIKAALTPLLRGTAKAQAEKRRKSASTPKTQQHSCLRPKIRHDNSKRIAVTNRNEG